jgi:hypothetical protein
MHDLNRSPHLLLHITAAHIHDTSHREQTSPGWRWTGVLLMSARRVVMVHHSVLTSTATATQQISRFSHLMVRCRYGGVIQRDTVRVCTHSMLLSVAHAGVQVPRHRSIPMAPRIASMDNGSAHSALSSSALVSRTGRMEPAEHTCRASIAPKELRHPTARPSRARSGRTTRYSRHRNGCERSRHKRQLHKSLRRSVYH